MINKAIAKITEEMMKMDDPLAQMIEEHLTKMCTTQSIAEKLLDSGKTLEGIHKKIWDEARRRKKKQGAFIPDQEIYDMIDEYYGISEAPPKTEGINVLDLL